MRADAPSSPGWEEGDESEVGPRGLPGLLLSLSPSLGRRLPALTGRCRSEGCKGSRDGRVPEPHPCGEASLQVSLSYEVSSSTQGCDLATRRTGWTQHPWTETKGRAPTTVSVNLVITGITPTLLTATPGFLCQQDAGWKCEIRGHLPGPGDQGSPPPGFAQPARRIWERALPAPPAAPTPAPAPLSGLPQGFLVPIQAGHAPASARRHPPAPVPRLPQGLLLPVQAGCAPPHAQRSSPALLPALPQGLRPPLQAGGASLDPRSRPPLPMPRLPQVLLLPLQTGGPPPHAPRHRCPPLPLSTLPQSVLVSLQTGGSPPMSRTPHCAQQPDHWPPPMLQL